MSAIPAPGPSDFRLLREQGLFYVDKTAWIAELLRRPEQVVLLPRPRRFGKTLNMTTLQAWLDREQPGGPDLFAGLAIEREDERIQAHRARYPVIFLSLKDIKARTWPECFQGIQQKLADIAKAHHYLVDSPALDPGDREIFEDYLSGRGAETRWWPALQSLTRWLYRHHGERVWILLDEYDAPIETGWLNGYYDEVTDFLRNLLEAGLKDNPSLHKGVLTGIRRVAKESLFSGLNNIVVFSLLDRPFETGFGFTEPEVIRTLEAGGLAERLDDVRRWYDGYVFGGERIYNPWSVLSFTALRRLDAHWVATSSDDLIRRVVIGSGSDVAEQIGHLLEGGSVRRTIDRHVVLRDIDRNGDAAWSLLLFAGYLKAEPGEDTFRWDLSIPNKDVGIAWRALFRNWLTESLSGARDVERLADGLLKGDTEAVQTLLGRLVETVLSYHDRLKRSPEKVYHLFVVGLLAFLEPRWRVRSEPESGFGRADVLVIPTEAGRPGAVVEFKLIVGKETAEQALDRAEAQLRERDYAAQVRAAGASSVTVWAVAFQGRELEVRLIGPA